MPIIKVTLQVKKFNMSPLEAISWKFILS